MCNATGTEKWPIFYIGKLKQPQCFGKKTPKQHEFWYRNNKTSWMTSEIFKQYVFKFPEYIVQQNINSA